MRNLLACVMLIGLLLFSGCAEENLSSEVLELSPEISQYVTCLGLSREETYKKLNIDYEKSENEEIGLIVQLPDEYSSLSSYLAETIEGKNFEVILEFYEWEENGRLRGFYYCHMPEPPFGEEEYLLAEKLVEVMKEAYGEPSGNEWQIGTSFSEAEDILQLADQEEIWLIDRWEVPMPKEVEERIDPELSYLEAFVELRKLDGELCVQFGYSLSATEKAIEEQSWLPGELSYLH